MVVVVVLTWVYVGDDGLVKETKGLLEGMRWGEVGYIAFHRVYS